MKAFIVNTYGPNAKFEQTDVPVPELKSGEVLIEVKATSVNPIDNKLLRYEIGLNPELPAVLHGDVAGVVHAKADDVTEFAVGDEVYGCAGGFIGSAGALADYMPVDSQLIAHKPRSLTFEQAAALPLVSITAWESVVDSAGIRAGEHVLIHGGTGGVGHVAIQIAKAKGAKVSTTVASEEMADLAKALGADEAIIYTEEDVASYVARLTEGKGFDLIYDTVGGANVEKSLQATRNYGRIVTVFTGTGTTEIDMMTAFFKAVAVHTQNMSIPLVSGEGRLHHKEILTEIAKLVDDGKLKPLVDKHIFSFEKVNEAHAFLESGKHVGKIVISK